MIKKCSCSLYKIPLIEITQIGNAFVNENRSSKSDQSHDPFPPAKRSEYEERYKKKRKVDDAVETDEGGKADVEGSFKDQIRYIFFSVGVQSLVK